MNLYFYYGCILLGLFWLFLFRFRNNRIHGISISKRTLRHVSDLETISEVTCELLYLRTHLSVSEHGARVGFTYFPKERVILSIPSKTHSYHSVHSVIGSRMNGMIFRLFRKRNSSQKNTYRLLRVFLFRNSPKRTRPIFNSILRFISKCA